MARLDIPKRLLPLFIEIVGNLLWDESSSDDEAELLSILEQFIENNEKNIFTVKACPYCGNETATMIIDGEYRWLRCNKCGACGPAALTREGAENEWRIRGRTDTTCPFCALEEKWQSEEQFSWDNGKWSIFCLVKDGCQSSGPLADTKEEAWELWRRRAN